MSQRITPGFSNLVKQVKLPASTVSKPQLHKYTLHCQFTKNNTHFTLCSHWEDLNNKILTSPLSTYDDKFAYWLHLPSKVEFKLSTGPMGFRKANRGEYEAGFQTATKCLGQLYTQIRRDKNLSGSGGNKHVPIDIVMKDFGKGRTAFITAMNGKEGCMVRPYIRQVSDATALKFGGVRSPGIRRL
ncbi:small ribosomal subunit protein uS11m [Monosporozyma unispora]|nr:hypothetical protein C6P44_001926 [Kazachstania unispora]